MNKLSSFPLQHQYFQNPASLNKYIILNQSMREMSQREIWPLNVYKHHLCSKQNRLPTHLIVDIMKWPPVIASNTKIRISRWCAALSIYLIGVTPGTAIHSLKDKHLSHPISNVQWWERNRTNITTNLNSKKGKNRSKQQALVLAMIKF